MTRVRPTIREVAARARVSIGTVSHVLTGRKKVRPDTRAAIDAAIHDLGYVPDAAARALIARRPRASPAPDPRAPRLTTVGYLCADHIARVDVLPHRDDRVRAAAIEKALGGCAANVAVTAAGLGEPLPVVAELLSVVGDDADSEWALAMLADRRVELNPISRRRGGRLSRCFILVEANGSRTIVNEPLQVPAADLAAWLEQIPIPSGAHGLHLQGDQIPELAPLLPMARDRGLKLSMQATGMVRAWHTPERLRQLCAHFDVIVLDRETAWGVVQGGRGSTAELVRRVGEMIQSPGAMVLLTLGPEGAALFQPAGEPLRVEARPVTPVDTTGAGDTLTGAFLAAWLNGVPMSEALHIGVAAGSLSIGVRGAQEHGLRAAQLVADTIGGTAGESTFERFTQSR